VIFRFDAELWLWDARQGSSWTFVSLPAEVSADIREVVGAVPRPGFGSVRVTATIGGSTWATSIFPAAGQGGYVLPIKKAVRTSEALLPGDVAAVTVDVVGLLEASTGD
jgi:Domain of unknown function (DUF1905)